MRIAGIVLFLSVLIWCCGAPNGDDLFYPARSLGKINSKLDEASGLVSSVNNPGKLWSINDSGNKPSVFLLNKRAAIELTCTLAKIDNRDWEDLALGRGPEPGVSYLYVGDIGDNQARYDLKYIYRFPEPVFSGVPQIVITKFDTITLRLPDRRRDTETLMLDPLTSDLFIISKREDSVHLYRCKYPFPTGQIITMEYLGKLPYQLIVAGSVSAGGKEVLLKNYSHIYYWKRSGNESLPALLLTKPRELAYEPEHQGESITWARDSSGFYTLSESNVADRANLWFYKRRISN